VVCQVSKEVIVAAPSCSQMSRSTPHLAAFKVHPRCVIFPSSPRSSIARRLGGSGDPGGTDAPDLQHRLLRFGAASNEFRKAVAEFVRWKANGNPPWAAHRALRAGRLMGFGKMPGVRPVGMGETLERPGSKCALLVCGDEAKGNGMLTPWMIRCEQPPGARHSFNCCCATMPS
jgi:hypothetical protein